MVSHTDAAGLVSEYEYDHYTPTGKVLRSWASSGNEEKQRENHSTVVQ